jgi:16S rRNA (guanine1207-N2)-methyltransferase
MAFHQLVYDAMRRLRVGGVCLVYGGNNEGIKTAARTIESLFGHVRVQAHSGGHRLLAATRTDALDLKLGESLAAPYQDVNAFRETAVALRGTALVMCSRPGVFSWEHLDEASAVLAEVMDIPRGAQVLDLGCGAGVLGAVAGLLSDGGAVTLVDADSEAVRCATRTLQSTAIASWRVCASDVTSAVRGESFDVVLCNPPFHTGKATDLALPRRFITEAHAVLCAGGRLQLVANRTLPYEAELERVFGNRRVVHDGARFKVLEATRR